MGGTTSKLQIIIIIFLIYLILLPTFQRRRYLKDDLLLTQCVSVKTVNLCSGTVPVTLKLKRIELFFKFKRKFQF